MKKILSIFICVLLAVTMLNVSVSAADEKVSVTAESHTVAVDGTVSLSVALSEGTALTADYIEISVIYSKQLDFASGEFTKTEGAEVSSDFESRTASASVTYKEPCEISGEIFKFTVKGVEVADKRTVRVSLTVKNGNTELLSVSQIDTSLKVICKEHNFSYWSVTTAADCENAGEQTRKCSICEFTEAQVIEAYGHDFSDMTILRPATCTEIGYERGFCSRCQQKLLQQIPATGHSMGEWSTVAAPTCTVKGTDESKCQSCNFTETRETEALGHEFQEAVITTQPTLGKKGIATGYCTRCSETTAQDVECAYSDSATGIILNTTYGVYPEETKTKITAVPEGHSGHDSIKNALAHITNRFVGYNIEATNRGFSVEPEGEVTATFPIPQEYGKGASVYYISDDGTVKKLSAAINDDGTTATVKFAGNGRYAVCKTGFSAGGTTVGGSVNLGVIVIVLAALTIIICWVTVAFKIIKIKNPALYKRLASKFPKYSQIRNAVRRRLFIIKESKKQRK